MKRAILVVLLLIALIVAFVAITTPSSSGGSVTYVGPKGKIQTQSLVVVSQKTWNRKGQVRRIGHGVTITRTRTRTASGPCYRLEAEVHGDSWAIDKVVQGLGHFKLCMKAADHTKVNDSYTSASADHRETWLWNFNGVDVTKGAGVSTTWCNGGVGPCLPLEYRYWRFTFHWMQGVSVFGQDFAHHKTLYIGCTLRAGNGGYQCGMGEA